MRSRNIKPAFFLNTELAEADHATRLLFIGLWCYSDRAGRFEWNPKRIKAAIFPFGSEKIETLLCNLMSLHLITCHEGTGYVLNFNKHQRPHPHEARSVLPALPVNFEASDIVPSPIAEKKEKMVSKFKPPILEEVKAYCKERGNSVDAQKWLDFYTAKGWLIGKNTMKDWQAAVRTWEQKEQTPVTEYKPPTESDEVKAKRKRALANAGY